VKLPTETLLRLLQQSAPRIKLQKHSKGTVRQQQGLNRQPDADEQQRKGDVETMQHERGNYT